MTITLKRNCDNEHACGDTAVMAIHQGSGEHYHASFVALVEVVKISKTGTTLKVKVTEVIDQTCKMNPVGKTYTFAAQQYGHGGHRLYGKAHDYSTYDDARLYTVQEDAEKVIARTLGDNADRRLKVVASKLKEAATLDGTPQYFTGDKAKMDQLVNELFSLLNG